MFLSGNLLALTRGVWGQQRSWNRMGGGLRTSNMSVTGSISWEVDAVGMEGGEKPY